ncbi:beta-L-arabinofuranosidase domain-containing protein [Jiangella asiatica]|uniref:Glycoside hydrolase family 127 protein n=1 Tax=Jiangella asiatica TaxID=2530372 RepID=A0A4R5DU52_9ACTN|nr:beta-L-arabinofuranosidase domain-containing protein [Jiangella asiatica]TDE15840.1 hypothetical protein E1269_00645 [Jiangella asiatica]
MTLAPGPVSTHLGGPLSEHVAAAAAQLARSTPYSVELVTQDVVWAAGSSRLFQDYRGDLSGRYLDAVDAALAMGLAVDRDKAAAVLAAVLGAQQPDGLFGPPALSTQVDQGSAWGHGRLLDGLLSARSWAPDRLTGTLEHATAQLAVAIAARTTAWGRWVGAAGRQKFRLDPFSVVLPLARYAAAAGSEPAADAALDAALALAEALPEDVERAHMHGYLLALRGQVEVGRLTGADHLVQDALARVEVVADRYQLPHGGVPESVSLPWDVNTEGCGIADWVMLNLRLHELTGEEALLDRAVVAAVNALLHTQRASGHFGCETLSGESGVLVSDYAPEAWWCCTFHGLRALHHLAERAVTVDDDAVRLHVPIATTRHDDDGATVVEVTGDYPYDDVVTVTAGRALRAGGLWLRVPPTASVAELRVDGEPVRADAAGGWVRLPAPPPGSRVTLRLRQHEWFSVAGTPMVPPFANTTLPAPDLSDRPVAVFRGPLLLAAGAADNDTEDVLRGRFLVHPREQPALARDDDGRELATVSGHDSFHASLRLAPLAGADRARNDRAVRAWFGGLRYERPGLHGH